GGIEVSHAKSAAGCAAAQATSAAKAPLHLGPGSSELSQFAVHIGSAHDSDASFLQELEQADDRSGSPPSGPVYQQACIASSALVQTPEPGIGCPLVSHEKLEDGCFARQSVAAFTASLHQLTDVLVVSHSVSHALTFVWGHAF